MQKRMQKETLNPVFVVVYANSFDHEFSLLLRERRPISLLNMQDATLEVESNILASNRLKKETTQQTMTGKERKKQLQEVQLLILQKGKLMRWPSW